jgi:hypothetical protein
VLSEGFKGDVVSTFGGVKSNGNSRHPPEGRRCDGYSLREEGSGRAIGAQKVRRSIIWIWRGLPMVLLTTPKPLKVGDEYSCVP